MNTIYIGKSSKESVDRNEKGNQNGTNSLEQQHSSSFIDYDSLSPIMIRHQLQGIESTVASNEPHRHQDETETPFICLLLNRCLYPPSI